MGGCHNSGQKFLGVSTDNEYCRCATHRRYNQTLDSNSQVCFRSTYIFFVIVFNGNFVFYGCNEKNNPIRDALRDLVPFVQF